VAHWFMEVLTGLFNRWTPDFDEDVWHDPLSST
jgi:hypothetical protein